MPDTHPDRDVIEAAGGLVWDGSGEGRRLAVIRRPKYGDWTLPKGKLEPGERSQAAAIREVGEETGCEVEITGFAGSVSYTVRGVPKVVLFWHMVPVSEPEFQPSEEVDEVEWLTVEEAVDRLTYPGERDLVQDTVRKEPRDEPAGQGV